MFSFKWNIIESSIKSSQQQKHNINKMFLCAALSGTETYSCKKSQTLDLAPTHLYLQTHHFLSQSYLSLSSSWCRTESSSHASQKHHNTRQQAKASEPAFIIWLHKYLRDGCIDLWWSQLYELSDPWQSEHNEGAPCLADPFITRWTQWPCFDSRSWSRTLIAWRRDCSHRLLPRKMISAQRLILNIHQQFQTFSEGWLKGHLL